MCFKKRSKERKRKFSHTSQSSKYYLGLTKYRISSKVFMFFAKFTHCLSPLQTYYPLLKKPKVNFLYRLKHDQKNSEYIKNTETFIKRIQTDKPDDFYNALGTMTSKTSFNY
jgi:hypothetical protein